MNNETNLQKIEALIPWLSLDDLRALNRQVYDLIGIEKRRQNALKRHTFKVGDMVTFKAKHGVVKTGRITRCKRAKAFVDTGDLRQWDVPFAMLEKVDG